MKTRSQNGSAHVVIIIILVVALLGALGFVFWQNFVNKPTASVSTASGQSYLKLTDFGVQIPYDSSRDALTVSKSSDTTNDTFYDVSSPKVLTACEGAGASSSDAGSIGIVSRDIANDKTAQDSLGAGETWLEYYANEPHVVIGQYVYVLGSPQKACADPSTTDGTTANNIQEDAYNTLKADFLKLTTL